MVDTIWSYYQNNRLDCFKGAYKRLDYILKRIIRLNKRKVLNVGVGNGYFEEMAKEKKLDVYSLDPDSETIKKIETNIGVKGKIGTLQNIPFPDNYFDAVVTSEVLEHIDPRDIPLVFFEINRVLSDDGILIGTVPMDENLYEQQLICPHCGKVFHKWGHKQSFSVESLRKELQNHFDIVEIKEKMFVQWRELNWKGHVLSFLKFMLYLVRVKMSGTNIFFIAKKSVKIRN